MDAMQCLIKTKTLTNSKVLQNCFGNIQKCNLNKYKKKKHERLAEICTVTNFNIENVFLWRS